MKHKKQKEKIVVLASSKKTHPDEYEKNCDRCGIKIYLFDLWDTTWKNQKIDEFICEQCGFKSANYRLDLDKKTVDSLNEEYNINLTKKDWLKIAKVYMENNRKVIAG